MLLLPLGIITAAKIAWPDKVTVKEFLACIGVVLMLMCVGYFVGRSSRTSDTEIWSGRIRSKTRETEPCSHSYECFCTTDSKGRTTCRTCYEHAYDVAWVARTTNDELAYRDGSNPPYSLPPSRWRHIRVGEPTAIEHSYTNYIRGNPDSVLRTRGFGERYRTSIPSYPEVVDHYRANRFLTSGVTVPDAAEYRTWLDGLNADLGRRRQVNIIVLVTQHSNPEYADGVRELWLGGKKNDVIVVVGAPDFPRIEWARVITWSRSEELKVNIRDRVMAMREFEPRGFFWILRDEVGHHFIRRPMHDFEYLAATITPPTWVIVLLTMLGILSACGLAWHAVHNDWFDEERLASVLRRSRYRY
jgi:hypothetical protein